MSSQPDDARGAHAAALTSLLLIAQQVAGKAARDALFLSSFSTAALPVVMAAGAFLSLAGVYWLSRVIVTKTPAVVMPALFGASSIGFVVDWVVIGQAPRVGALLVYFQTALLSPIMISTFWSLINERFDPRTAKRAASRIAAGGTLGGVLGGLAVWRASSVIEPLTILLVLAALNAGALLGTLVTRARQEAILPATVELSDAAAMASPLATLRDAPFLRSLALLVGLGAAISALLDYVFSVQATAAFTDGKSLLAFFSLFWLTVGLVSLVLQLVLGRIALEKLGLAVNITILPGVIVLGGAFGLAVPGLLSASLLRGAEAVQRNTLFRAAYELLYTPVPEASKRATKTVIDVGCDRVGTVLGSGLVFAVVHLMPHAASSWLLGSVLVLALVTLPVARRLHLGYVRALEQGLREGAAKLGRASTPTARLERSTRASRAGQRQRDELVERIEVLQPGGLSALVTEPRELATSAAPPERAPSAAELRDDWLDTARALLTEDAEAVRRALQRLEPQSPAVACGIRLLGHPTLHEHAVEALRAHAARLTGQLLDSLLDPEVDFAVRRRIPRVLSACSTQRAADGLLLGIADERFEVRYECGLSLLKLTDSNPDIVISEARVVAAIRREIESGQELAEQSAARALAEERPGEEQALVEGLVRDRVDRSLEHMFAILSLILEREPLRMAFAALHHEDQKYRGTALEYLDTVLPRDVRDMMWPYLGESAPLASVRSPSELLTDLLAATGAPPTRPSTASRSGQPT
jgi:ATP:ADP antiporter, AAA family